MPASSFLPRQHNCPSPDLDLLKAFPSRTQKSLSLYSSSLSGVVEPFTSPRHLWIATKLRDPLTLSFPKPQGRPVSFSRTGGHSLPSCLLSQSPDPGSL